jgi:hypothetical protein
MRSLPALVVIALLGACASTKFNPFPGAPEYSAYPGEVTVLKTFPQSGSYDSLGIVVVYGVDLTDEEDLIEALQKEAAGRGANAIVLQGDVNVRTRGGYTEKVLAAYALRLKP